LDINSRKILNCVIVYDRKDFMRYKFVNKKKYLNLLNSI